MPPGAPSTPGWVYDASSGYYHDPSTGAYFDQQRGAYHVNGRWVGHAEFTATRVASAASPQHVVHPSLSRGGVGESAVGGGSANLVHHPAAIPGAAGAAPRSNPGWGASVPAYASSSSGAYDPSGARASASANAYDPGGGTGNPAVSASFVAPAPVVARPTALGQAAERGDVRECARLIRSGEDPDAPGPLGNRPLHYAAHEGHGRIVELLLAGERADGGERRVDGGAHRAERLVLEPRALQRRGERGGEAAAEEGRRHRRVRAPELYSSYSKSSSRLGSYSAWCAAVRGLLLPKRLPATAHHAE